MELFSRKRKNATDAKIIEILGLTADQFSQIVMIAQGDFLKLFVYKVGRAENDLFQIIQDRHLLEDPENLRRKSMEMDERIQENDRHLSRRKAGSFCFLKVKNYRWMNLWSVCGNG